MAEAPRSIPSDDGKIAVSDDENIAVSDDGVTSVAREQRLPPMSIRHLSPEERLRLETKMRRRIDIRLMPMLILMYILNYLDRNNIAAARLVGLETELGLTSTQYQVCFAHNLSQITSEYSCLTTIIFRHQ